MLDVMHDKDLKGYITGQRTGENCLKMKILDLRTLYEIWPNWNICLGQGGCGNIKFTGNLSLCGEKTKFSNFNQL